MKLIPLNSPYWETYTGAYGSVLPEIKLLSGAEPMTPQTKLHRLDFSERDDYQIAFDNLCENLSHQMTCYNALFLALPYMVELFERKKAEDSFIWQADILSQAGVCLATDIPDVNGEQPEPLPEEITSSYNAAVLRLEELAKEFLLENINQIRLMENNSRNFLITGLIAVLGERVFANVLTFSAWNEEECHLACPDCDFFDEESSLTDDEIQSHISPAKIEPWDGKSFDNPPCWMYGVLDRLGAEREKQFVPWFYGTFTCPVCGRKAPLLDFAKAYLYL